MVHLITAKMGFGSKEDYLDLCSAASEQMQRLIRKDKDSHIRSLTITEEPNRGTAELNFICVGEEDEVMAVVDDFILNVLNILSRRSEVIDVHQLAIILNKA